MRSALIAGVCVLAVVLAGCGSWEETISEGRDLIDDTMEGVFPRTEYVVSTAPVICEFRSGKHYVSIQAEFEVSTAPEQAAAAVAESWKGRDDTANIEGGFDTVLGNTDWAVIGFGASSDGVGSISVQGGPCRDETVPVTSIVVTPGDG